MFGGALGYNVDYFLVARFGWVVPDIVRRLLGGTWEGESDCGDLGRRVVLPRDRQRAALEFASTFWLVLVFASFGLTVSVVCGLGAVDHRLLAGPLPSGAIAVFLGGMAFSMTAALFAGTRKRWLDDPVVRRHSRREVPGLATPKPYDFLVALAAGVLGAAASWAG
jgi:hypothetical protein